MRQQEKEKLLLSGNNINVIPKGKGESMTIKSLEGNSHSKTRNFPSQVMTVEQYHMYCVSIIIVRDTTLTIYWMQIMEMGKVEMIPPMCNNFKYAIERVVMIL